MRQHLDMRHTAETKRKLSAMRRGKLNPFYGHKHSPEVVEAMRQRTIRFNANRTYDIQPRTIQIPSGFSLGYLAGLIDGEGSIIVRRGSPCVVVYNTNRKMMEWLKANVGGSWKTGDRRGRKPNLYWHITSARNCALLLEELRGCLIEKEPQRQAVLKFLIQKYGARLWEK